MQKQKNLMRFYGLALACGLALVSVSIPDAMAGKKRGKSGLPDGPGNPIAQVYKELQDLKNTVADLAPKANLLWINYLDFVPGDVDVIASYNSTSAGLGVSGLAGLIITSTTLGEVSVSGGNKVIEKGLQVPPGYKVAGVRVCFESSNPAGSFISQIRISQLQDPPDTRAVLLDDGTDLTNVGPVCVDSASPTGGPIDPSLGSLLLSLRVNFSNVLDKIVIRAVGLHLAP